MMEHDRLLAEKLEMQRELARDIENGDYVVWDAWKTHRNERSERIITFGGIEAVRTYTATASK